MPGLTQDERLIKYDGSQWVNPSKGYGFLKDNQWLTLRV